MKRVIVRQSSVHGRGVFAAQALAAGERVLQYKGETVSWREATRRHRREGIEGHTFLFGLSDGSLIDGSRSGNSARWLNHSCAPNCETVEDNGRIFIDTLRIIRPGEELYIDYSLEIEEPHDEAIKAQYQCRCAAKGCRQSLLAGPA